MSTWLRKEKDPEVEEKKSKFELPASTRFLTVSHTTWTRLSCEETRNSERRLASRAE